MQNHQIIIIGNGLMGSAAARYLSEWTSGVCVIGTGEPADHSTHGGVFSSHYDQGRLTSKVGMDPVWGVLANRAIQKFDWLEQQSGVPFHGEPGRLWAKRAEGEDAQVIEAWLARAAQFGVEMAHYPAGDLRWKEQFPYFDFPEDYDVVYEPAPAGYLNPRQLIAAQNAIAKQQGATFVEQVATAVNSTPSGVTVTTNGGDSFHAEKVLLATGAFTNFHNLLPAPLPLMMKTESMVWGTVSQETAVSLQNMPSLGYAIDDPDIDDPYTAPPLLYPDGTYKIKMGANTKNELWPQTLEETQAWFQSGDSDQDLPALIRGLKSQLPDVPFLEFTSHRCIVTYTPSGYPIIDQVPSDENGRLYAALGGNGSGAQGSDALGELAAGLVLDGRWPDWVEKRPFRATTQWGDSSKRLTKAQKRALNRVNS